MHFLNKNLLILKESDTPESVIFNKKGVSFLNRHICEKHKQLNSPNFVNFPV
jgi:hypothetical protein